MSEELKGNPDFSGISPCFHVAAKEDWVNGNPADILIYVGHRERGEVFKQNIDAFLCVGAYEEALEHTYTHGPYLHPSWWQAWFLKADLDKLRRLGDPLPSAPIRVYRGIRDSKRRIFIRGISWTTDPHIAAWFASRFDPPNPAVYSMIVNPEDIFLMTNGRAEAEVMVAAWRGQKLKRLAVMPEPRQGKHAGEEEGV